MIKIKKANLSIITQILTQYWGGNIIISRGTIHYADELRGYCAYYKNQLAGCITFEIRDISCEITSINRNIEEIGIRTKLVDAVIQEAKNSNCQYVWLITTNDNIDAIKFWQKYGFDLKAIHHNAVKRARKKKPKIPMIGHFGIPIKHELEFKLDLNS
jgi:N-acetylglutamate synthase-like GNAT family acetyltransferase